ncbi:MAG: molecular chaperone HtpG [Ruminococcaceae bacterium]|nr:molecular chaperone HtpG [Oscillospiraceae bacterium]MBQ9914356.1 molecular chaperone HtpG [Clostridia bacterium]
MAKKQFKAESKKLMDMMINSIYTHKDIFLRELISNASDALDKRYYRSLSQGESGSSREDYKINLAVDKENRTLTVSDNGCGMNEKELETNLGTIAKSGSLDFKGDIEKGSDVEIIGQFGVGFYSAFMVADKVTVISKALGEDKAYKWESSGVDGYVISEAEKAEEGTVITLKIKENTENDNYDKYLDQYGVQDIVTKYSDYIRYPIMLDMSHTQLREGTEDEYETVTEPTQLNSMVPLWRKNKNEITADDYNNFYMSKFYDFEAPLKTIHSKTEGQISYDALMYIPSHAPFDFYSKDYEKGLQLYSNGVLIMDKCAELLPDYFSFVKGLVDSADLSLNISRELLQQDHILKVIAKNVEKKIKNELSKMLTSDREAYEKFFAAFGVQLKYGLYSNYGMNKETLQDLVMFHSSNEKKLTTLKEYTERMREEQKTIYYASGETIDKIDLLPQADAVKSKGYEILYFTDDVDEFAIQMLREYDGKTFTNVCAAGLDLQSDEEKEAVSKKNEDEKELLAFLKESIGDSVSEVRFTSSLKNHPVCLTTEGMLSLEMEKVLSAMPGAKGGAKATLILEISTEHPIAEKLVSLYAEDKEKTAKYAKILYAQSCLIAGRAVDNPAEFSEMICELM